MHKVTIKQDIDMQITITDYLKNFTKPIKTQYEKKKPKRLLIESNSDEPVIKPKKTKMVIQETSSVSHAVEEKPVEKKPRKTKEIKETKENDKSKKNIKIKGNNVSKKNVKKKKFLIIDSSNTE